MKLIIGLGNPGAKYQKTRHNIGFMTVDALASGADFKLDKKFVSQLTQLDGSEYTLVKPQTFMNNSGEAVVALKQFYKLDNDDIWVISDDLALEFGKIRIRRGGSSGGQNGLASIIRQIGDDFWRIRLGIGNSTLEHLPAEVFVLNNFGQAEAEKLPEFINQASAIITRAQADGIEPTSHTLPD